MEGYINENRWIDLSVLPRHGEHISWVESVGYIVPFQYENIKGNINIVGLGNTNFDIYITIDKYVPQPRKICIANLRKCELRKLVYNRIIDIRSDLLQYLDNIDDAYLYSVGSNYPIDTHCPICGYQTKLSASDLSTKGFRCPICGKGFSYPSKLMANILTSLHIPFIREASKTNVEFQWAQNYRYDFYIRYGNRKIIIEMDGWFHQFNKTVDEIKDYLAISNGFEIIRIDSNYKCISSRLQYIKDKILNSELSYILPLEQVDWSECNRLAVSESLVQIVGSLWENEHKCVKEISELCHTGRETIVKYLKIAKELGLCPTYNPRESEIRSHCKCVAVYNNDDEITHVFRSMTEASMCSNDVLGVNISIPMIGLVCNGISKTAKGFKMSMMSYEDYMYYNEVLNEQRKMIENNNEVVFKEAI